MLQETIGNCLSLVDTFISEKEVVLVDANVYNWEHISYDSKDERHYEILSIKGKKTKKYLHVCIYRHDSGRYELNQYIL